MLDVSRYSPIDSTNNTYAVLVIHNILLRRFTCVLHRSIFVASLPIINPPSRAYAVKLEKKKRAKKKVGGKKRTGKLTGGERSIDIVATRAWGDPSREGSYLASRPTRNDEILAEPTSKIWLHARERDAPRWRCIKAPLAQLRGLIEFRHRYRPREMELSI